MEIKISTDDIVSVTDAAVALGRPRVTIYQWIRRGKVHGIRFGDSVYVPRSEVDRLQKELAKKSKAA